VLGKGSLIGGDLSVFEDSRIDLFLLSRQRLALQDAEPIVGR
jgi:hypothetical protein